MTLTDGRTRAYDATRRQTDPGTYAYFLEVAAANERQAGALAARNRTVARLSWFAMTQTEVESGRWLVKVAYIVDPA